MKKLMVAVVGACASLVSFAYDWTGKTGVVTLTETAEVTDADAATVAALDGIILEGAETDIIFRNTTALTLSGYISGDGTIVKQGSGDLLFGKPHALTATRSNSHSSTPCADYLTKGGIRIETGHLYCPQDGGVVTWYGPVVVEAGATFHIPVDKACGVDSLNGAGTVYNANIDTAKWYVSPATKTALAIGAYGSTAKSVFSGNFVGAFDICAPGDSTFSGTSSYGAGSVSVYRNNSGGSGVIRLAKFGVRGPYSYNGHQINEAVFAGYPSTFGLGDNYFYGIDFDINYSGRLEYVGEGGEETNKKIRFGHKAVYGRPETIDAGAQGGVTFTGEWTNYTADKNYYIRGSLLTGSNAVDMVLKPSKMETDGGVLFFRKGGTGAWRLSGTAAAMIGYVGAWFVDEGTLKFDSIADVGVSCSMGTATNCLAYCWDKGTSDWMDGTHSLGCEIALGASSGDWIPTLEYTGTGAASSNRRIGLIGKGGRIANNTENGTLSLSGGIFPVPISNAVADVRNPVETTDKKLFLEASGSGNVLGKISENAAGSISLIKTGAGLWTITNDFAVSGDIEVREGELALRPNGYAYDWYRFTITHLKNKSGADAQTAWFYQLALFDENGDRIVTDLEFVYPKNDAYDAYHEFAGNYDPDSLKPGQVTMGAFPQKLSISTGNTPEKAFKDNSTSYRASLNKTIAEGGNAMPIVFRLPKGSSSPRYIDYVNTYDWNAFDHLISFKLEGSSNGETWTELVHKTGDCQRTNKQWDSTGVEYAAGQNCRTEGKEFGYEITTDGSEGGHDTVDLSHARSVKVMKGAIFDVRPEGVVTLPKLTVDCAGTGVATVKGFKIAETGVLTLVNAPRGEVKLPVAFADCTDVKNLEGWTATVEGSARNRYTIEVSDGEVTLRPFGMAILIR